MNMTPTSPRILRSIVDRGSESVFQLADCADCKWETAKLALTRLEQMGAIRIKRGPNGRISARATERGRALAYMLKEC